VQNDELAKDIHQDVFIKIHENIESLKDDKKVKSWVLQITRNTILDYYNSNKKSISEIELSNLQDQTLDIYTVIDNKSRNLETEITEGLIPLINSLPKKYAEAIRLVEFEGLSQVQLAKKLNISPSGAKSRVQRGRKLIKETLLNCCHYKFDKYGKVIDLKSFKSCCVKKT